MPGPGAWGLALGLLETSHLCVEGSLSWEQRPGRGHGVTSDRDPACLVPEETSQSQEGQTALAFSRPRGLALLQLGPACGSHPAAAQGE